MCARRAGLPAAEARCVRQRPIPKGYTPIDRTSYGLGWGTLLMINAGLAQAKGKSGLLWGVISLFIGPLATLILVTVYAHAGPSASA